MKILIGRKVSKKNVHTYYAENRDKLKKDMDKLWNHEIKLIELDGSHTEYTDRVEIKAGWKTLFIWL